MRCVMNVMSKEFILSSRILNLSVVFSCEPIPIPRPIATTGLKISLVVYLSIIPDEKFDHHQCDIFCRHYLYSLHHHLINLTFCCSVRYHH